MHQLKRSEATLTPREANNIINSTRNYRDRCILKCLYYGGLRVQEVVNLEAGGNCPHREDGQDR